MVTTLFPGADLNRLPDTGLMTLMAGCLDQGSPLLKPLWEAAYAVLQTRHGHLPDAYWAFLPRCQRLWTRIQAQQTTPYDLHDPLGEDAAD